MSLPSRERGLKLDEFQSETGDYCVAPLAGAWIEIPEIKHHRNVIVSLPSRERGLKFCTLVLCTVKAGRSPRGSVD